ncbi:methylenetetrahydrofolate reductase [SAR86 cluster bacterium]|nr:methylenetetrahydrofolate reductase [SAR86 cluster bacterium]|tara:strand:- start:207 stop:1061 length:855 start_codon:yes stop_codon:yes gene_type:complete
MEVNKNIQNFLAGYSIEVTPNAAAKIDNFSDVLPKNTLVYIAHIEGTSIDEMVNTAKKLKDHGFESMPHFPARIIKNKPILHDWISRYKNEAGVSQALLLAGGANKPYGDFDSSIDLLESDLFNKADFKTLHVAGHPEGSKDIDPDGSNSNTNQALLWKNDFNKKTDANMAIVTQFCFEASTVISWANEISDLGVNIPVHIGIAGPAKLQTLLRYSIECGVGASINVIKKRAKDITKLLLPYEPNNIISDLANHKKENPSFIIEKVHFFPLGGIKTAAKWAKSA